LRWKILEATEVIFASGHGNIQATHRTTLEITKDADVSKNGDCIIAVSADKTLCDLKPRFKDLLRREDARLTVVIEAGGIAEVANASGSPRLTFTHPTDIVIRKSEYICDRTLAIKTDKAARNLSRELVKNLKNCSQRVKVTLTVRA